MNLKEVLTPHRGSFNPEVWVALEGVVINEIQERLGYLAEGSRSNYERDIGFIQGLKWVLDAAKQAMKG